MTRILIVDDNRQDRNMLEALLKGYGYEVTSAGNGIQALLLAQEEPPDMIISDIMMPVMDGFALCREWKMDEKLKTIPFIFYTATYTSAKDEEFAFNLGADRYIIKPLEPKAFHRKLLEVIEEDREGLLAVSESPLGEEMEFFRQYNDVLFKKLELKIMQLQKEVSQRKRSERALHRAEENIRTIYNSISGHMTVVNKNYRIVNYNKTVERMFGKDLAGKVCYETYQGRKEICPDCAVKKTLETGEPAFTFQPATSISPPFDIHAYPIFDEKGELVAAIEHGMDVTERVKAEEELLKRKLLLNETQRISRVGGWEYDVITGKVTWTEETYRIYGVTPSDYDPNDIGQDIEFYANGDKVMIENAFKKAVEEGQTYDLELKFRNARGKDMWVRTIARPEYKDGRVVRVYGNIMDITERKHAELALQERSKRYHALFEQAGDGIFMLDTNGKILSVNETFARMHGLSAEEIIQNGLDKLDVEGVTKIPERIDRILAGETLSFEVEHYHKDGHIFPLLVTANLITTVNERFIIAIHRDLSERKRAEEALRESKALVEAVVENVPLMIFLKEAKDLRFVIFNKAGEELVGFNRKDLLGKNDLDFFPPEQAANFTAKDREVLAGELGMLDIPEEPIMTAKKGERLLHTRKVCIRGADGTTKYLLGISEDITERKKGEDKIRASLEEKEVLLREIHHRVKNNMQIISSLLNLQMGYIKDKKVIDIFSESQNRILTMALVHEKLYRSSDLRNVDFKGYINDLGANLLQSYNANNIKLNLNVEDISLDIDLAVPVGLIINELITNSIKYAFPDGMKGEITISFRSIGENMLELAVSDNGIGLAKDLDVKKSKTLGLHLVTSLAESQLQGQIDIYRDKGTEFQIKFKGGK